MMKAMVLEKIGAPLVLKQLPIPIPKENELLIKVLTCGVCRTDLHIVDGDLPSPPLPLILGHQVVGEVIKVGDHVKKYKVGDRVGVPWLGGSCQSCEFCLSHRENLCDTAIYTGYLRNGGFAEYCTADAEYSLKVPDQFDNLHASPLLCAGLIGYRAYKLIKPAQKLGLYGFGSSAHILLQVLVQQGKDVHVFTRPGDTKTQEFARSLGAKSAKDSDLPPDELLDASLLFAPVGALYPIALKGVKKGGKVISVGIHMSDIPSFPYSLLWGERTMTSVANLTREDGDEFMKLLSKVKVDVTVTSFPLEKANEALECIKSGKLEGSAVLDLTGG